MNTKTNILQIKPFQETLHSGYCGPASLKMVFSYYGVEKTEEELAILCGRSSILGVNDKALKRVAKSFGFDAEIQNHSTYKDIQRWLNRGVPVIVDWFSRGRTDYAEGETPDGHYSVVVGLDSDNIYLQDPETGHMRVIDRNDFMRVWFDFNGSRITSFDKLIIRQLIAIYRR